MKHDSQTSPRQRPTIFASRPGAKGRADKYHVVDLRTDAIVAAIPHWYDEADAKHSTEQLVEALHAFYFSGGYFPTPQPSDSGSPAECRAHLLASAVEGLK